MNEKEVNEKRLETALLEFIEQELKEPSRKDSTKAIPAMAQVLLRLWGYH